MIDLRSLKLEQAKAAEQAAKAAEKNAKDIAELQLQQRKASFTTRELHHIGSVRSGARPGWQDGIR